MEGVRGGVGREQASSTERFFFAMTSEWRERGPRPPTDPEIDPGAYRSRGHLAFIDFECARWPIPSRFPLGRAPQHDKTRSFLFRNSRNFTSFSLDITFLLFCAIVIFQFLLFQLCFCDNIMLGSLIIMLVRVFLFYLGEKYFLNLLKKLNNQLSI